MNKLVSLFFVCSLVVCAQDVAHTSTLTLGAGGLPYSYDPSFSGRQGGGPTFTGNYEYRLSRYLAAEAGVDFLLPSGQVYAQSEAIYPSTNLTSYSSNCTNPSCYLVVSDRSRLTLLTYGFKGILPIASDRVELFAGIGGAYAWNSASENGFHLNSALGQASLGARLAIDQSHRFWLGTTLRGFSTIGTTRLAGAPWTFDLGIRFGH